MSKAKPRAKRTGSVYQRESDGRWVASLDLPSSGKRRRKVITGLTEAKVRAELDRLRKQKELDGDLPTANTTLGQWLNIWYRDIATRKVRPKTAAVYRTMLEQYIIPTIGDVKLDRLTPAHVRRVEAYILEKGLSSATAAQAHRVLSVALKYAVREKRVTGNVAADTDPPRRSRRTLSILSTADAITVLGTAADDRLGSRWAAALLAGARQGELLGLELDRVTDSLDLSWQLQRVSWEHGCKSPCGAPRASECPDRTVTAPADWERRYLTGGLWLSRPKSNAGWRIIPLVDPLRSMIQRRIEDAAHEPNPFGLLWTSDPKRIPGTDRTRDLDGSPIDPSADNAAWHELLKRAGVGDVRLHDARHTTASLLLEAQVAEPIAMRILGHSSYMVTRAYQNVDYRQLEDAMGRVSAILTPISGGSAVAHVDRSV